MIPYRDKWTPKNKSWVFKLKLCFTIDPDSEDPVLLDINIDYNWSNQYFFKKSINAIMSHIKINSNTDNSMVELYSDTGSKFKVAAIWCGEDKLFGSLFDCSILKKNQNNYGNKIYN